MELPKSIQDIIDKRLNINTDAKKARGEVFTPLSLIAEMLLGVSANNTTEVWSGSGSRIGGLPLKILKDPKGKWIDPAAGVGNFGVVAFHILDYHLHQNDKSILSKICYTL